MDVVLLAGGYATRLYPLTKNQPKALLPLAGKSILDHNVDAIKWHPELNQFYLVTNERFIRHFADWKEETFSDNPDITLINDRTDSNDNRLGAVGDLKYVIDHTDVADSDFTFVIGTDNVADFDISRLIDIAMGKNTSAVFTYKYEGAESLSKKGVITVKEDGYIDRFAEKSPNPPSSLVVPPFYIFTQDVLNSVDEYLRLGNNQDAPGYFLSWLVNEQSVDIFASFTERKVLDIGTRESYEKAKDVYGA